MLRPVASDAGLDLRCRCDWDRSGSGAACGLAATSHVNLGSIVNGSTQIAWVGPRACESTCEPYDDSHVSGEESLHLPTQSTKNEAAAGSVLAREHPTSVRR